MFESRGRVRDRGLLCRPLPCCPSCRRGRGSFGTCRVPGTRLVRRCRLPTRRSPPEDPQGHLQPGALSRFVTLVLDAVGRLFGFGGSSGHDGAADLHAAVRSDRGSPAQGLVLEVRSGIAPGEEFNDEQYEGGYTYEEYFEEYFEEHFDLDEGYDGEYDDEDEGGQGSRTSYLQNGHWGAQE